MFIALKIFACQGGFGALKEVQPDPNLSAELQAQAQTQFQREASILAQLDHPNLPKVSDFFHDDGRDFLVMDYVPGFDLRELTQKNYEQGQLPDAAVVLGWTWQILDALEASLQTGTHPSCIVILNRPTLS